ncbi:response regulator transcription factor [Haloglomus halophilum]|jgi:DNA-binding response OmpR family regulator|uniref:response regulator transcription factor n=1 Tax=Haloglomus halophilum TaxID=2962672 RepID=UPI0020C93F45|nr:HalX domain-containing protein [Haloglomus halophilum]
MTASDGERTVLVVDDEPDLTDLYAAWLDEGYETRVAYGGKEAIEAFDEDVDVALIDRLMPEMSGDEVLEHIRETGHDCQVAMVTAVEPDFDIIEMGFDDYLVKPILRDELLEAVRNLLSRVEYDNQLRDLYALVSKRAALVTQKSEEELSNSQEYQELEAEIEELQAELDRTAMELTDDDFEVAFRKLSEN